MKSILLLSTLLLTGCATYTEQFDCEPERGVGCKSVSEVNQLVDQGELGLLKIPCNLPRSHATDLKIWMTRTREESGILTDPHFVYVSLKG